MMHFAFDYLEASDVTGAEVAGGRCGHLLLCRYLYTALRSCAKHGDDMDNGRIS